MFVKFASSSVQCEGRGCIEDMEKGRIVVWKGWMSWMDRRLSGEGGV